MKQTFGKLLRTAALTTMWSLSVVGITQHARAQQAFNPKYNQTMTVLKEIEENCNLDDAALAQSMHRHLNDFITEAKAAGIPDIEQEPIGMEVFRPGLLATLRRTGFIDLSISTRQGLEQGPRFICQIS